MKLKLKNPNEYKGNWEHPALMEINGNEESEIKKATITPDSWIKGWFSLNIEFKNGKSYFSCSHSIRGCKQIFAFQVRAGSKWENIHDKKT